ncbi:hypothetical protein [Streptomyces sp. NPDC046727]|uniref:hypothetical protein n=1 Tax=Streptomyces sp. NPDC046727 TaxID=3155373 RepID=UPI0033CD10CE
MRSFVLDPDREHLRLLGLLLLIRSLPLTLLPLAGCLSCFAFPLRLTRPLLLSSLQSLLLSLVLASSAATTQQRHGLVRASAAPQSGVPVPQAVGRCQHVHHPSDRGAHRDSDAVSLGSRGDLGPSPRLTCC